MREIEFRGKSVEHNVWVYGYYIKAIGDLIVEKRSSISTMEYVVEENSVGQFIGLRDKHDVKIYEGDIVKIGAGVGEEEAVVLYECDKCIFIMHTVGKEYDYSFVQNNGVDHLNGVEVIGNIYDNPELLGE